MGFWSRLWRAITNAAHVEVIVDNLLESVKAERAKYPAPIYDEGILSNPIGDQAAYTIVNNVAYQHRADGWGLKYKPEGHNFNQRAVDILIHKPSGRSFDVLGNSETDGIPTWNELTGSDAVPISLWRAPVAPATPIPVDPVPTPVDPPIVPPSPVLARLEAAITAFCRSWLGV